MSFLWKREYSGGASMRSMDTAPSKLEVQCRSFAKYVQGNLDAPYRVLVICTHQDATVDISFLRPLETEPLEFAVMVLDEASLNELCVQDASINLAFIVEAFNPTHSVLCRYFGHHIHDVSSVLQRFKIPTACFLDDDLLDVPHEAGPAVFEMFQNIGRREALTESIRVASLQITSTSNLRNSLQPRFPQQRFEVLDVYRSVTSEEFHRIPDSTKSPRLTIGYMASQSHANDLNAWIPGIAKLMDQRPEVHFETFGTIQMPSTFARFGDRVTAHGKANSYGAFLEKLRGINWTVGLAPLSASSFNANKANTKWVEYTLAGIPTIASNGPVYDIPARADACEIARPETLFEKLHNILENHEIRERLCRNSVNLLERTFTASAHRDNLRNIFDQLSAVSLRKK